MNPHQSPTTFDDLLQLPPPPLVDSGLRDDGYQNDTGFQIENCPSPERIWEVHCGRSNPDGAASPNGASSPDDVLSPNRVGEILDHVTICPTCSNEFQQARRLALELGEIRSLQDFEQDTPALVSEGVEIKTVRGPIAIDSRQSGSERSSDTLVARRPLWFYLMPLAATVLFMVGALSFWLPLDPRDLALEKSVGSSFLEKEEHRSDDVRGLNTEQRNASPESRNLVSATAHNGVAVRSLIADGRTLTRDRFVLRWEGPEDARYAVRVLTLEAVLYTDSDLKTTELLVPEQQLAEVTSGTTILWQVDATVPGGVPVSSTTFRVKLE